jgi:hypothetical protein
LLALKDLSARETAFKPLSQRPGAAKAAADKAAADAASTALNALRATVDRCKAALATVKAK